MSSSKPPPSLQGEAGLKIELTKKCGAGCFGEVWRGKDKETGKDIAVKLEELKTQAPQLEFEYDVAKKLAGDAMDPLYPQGFALPCSFFKNAGRHCALSMPLLGPTLENMMERMRGKLSPKTTMMLAEQVLRRLEYLHALGIVHRDIKPENFMLGRGSTENHVHLIDFGLSRAYWVDDKHRKYRDRLNLTGTARYASLNAHKGIEQSRRDDLEASGYMLVYFLRGAMPWSGLAAKTQKEKFQRIAEVKASTDLGELCEGQPACFKAYIEATRALTYDQRPDYNALRALYRNDFDAKGYVEDYAYDWYKGKPPEGLEPIGAWDPPNQPDDDKITRVVSRSRMKSDACELANERLARKNEEVDRIKKTFESWDKNHDGGIDQEEFRKVLLSIGVNGSDVDTMFDRADVNHDGKINYAEFMAWIQGDIPREIREEVYAMHGDHEETSAHVTTI
jgi:serine/threonine protein kinase